jgi:hypothetical protein
MDRPQLIQHFNTLAETPEAIEKQELAEPKTPHSIHAVL